jgi:hypothetical protein
VGAGVGTGVLVGGAVVAVGALVGATVGATVLAGVTIGDEGGAVVGCAGACVPGIGVGRAGAAVPPLALGGEACGEGRAVGEAVSDGLGCGFAGIPLFALSATSRIAVKAASASPMASAGPSTRYSANDVRTGRSLMPWHFESHPTTPTRDKAHFGDA